MAAMGDSSASGAPGLVPVWVGLAWALVFTGVLVVHGRHLLAGAGPRRGWHGAHVLMAAAMIVMYLPGVLGIPASAWRAGWGIGLGGLGLCGAYALLVERRAPSALWLLVAGDGAAMLEMGSPGLLSVALGGFLLGETVLWASDRARALDRPLAPGGLGLTGTAGPAGLGLVGGSGGLGLGAGTVALGVTLELRVSMVAMSLGMAYMLLAMAV
jgi:hypothetical protein